MTEADRLNALALAEWRKLMGIREPCFEPTYPTNSLYDAMLLVDAVLTWRDIRGRANWVFRLESVGSTKWRAVFHNDEASHYVGIKAIAPAEAITKAFLQLCGVDYE